MPSATLTASNLSAQFGAITLSRESLSPHRQTFSSALNPGAGQHAWRPSSSAVTIPPLTNDRAAIERSLWFATNRGYARALDSYLKVQTEQQVRRRKKTALRTSPPKSPRLQPSLLASPLSVDTPAWEKRLRELCGIFLEYPDILHQRRGASLERDRLLCLVRG